MAGIGEKTVVSIIGYRDRLGGFLRAEQLAEGPGVTERNYEKILKQIYCDSWEIRKIDINFASPKELGRHPYIPPQTLRKLLMALHRFQPFAHPFRKFRQLEEFVSRGDDGFP